MRGINDRFAFSEKNRKGVWKEHMQKTMNKENAWDQKNEICIVEGPVREVSSEEITSAIKKSEIRESIWTFRREHGNDKCK